MTSSLRSGDARLYLAAGLSTALAVLLTTTPALAGPRRITFSDAAGAPVCSTLRMCTRGSDCASATMTCSPFPGHGFSICTSLSAVADEAFCCADRTDCPPDPDGLEVACVPFRVAGPTGALLSSNVCVNARQDWCVGLPVEDIDPVAFEACVTPPGGFADGQVLSWTTGDCDGDGVPNAMDSCVCLPGEETPLRPGCPALVTPDAGTSDAGSTDAGVVDDGGVVVPDASVIDDGGVIVPDASVTDSAVVEPDAGVTDSGGVEPDAGREDSATPPPDVDSGPAPAEGTFTGAGGCAVSGTGASALPWLALIGLALMRRRRR